jgi:two-component system, LytTR family, response regulator
MKKMIRALVADDDANVRGLLAQFLEGTGVVSVVGHAGDGSACLQLVEELSPDVLFLDIRMPGMDGMEVAEAALNTGSPPLIVFVTGHDEYAVRAFRLAAADYIVKPLEVDEFETRVTETVARLGEALGRRDVAISALQKAVRALALNHAAPAERRLPVKDYEEGTVRLVDPATVTHIERVGNQVVLHTAEKAFRTYHTIDRLEERLRGAGFVRASRAALINGNAIQHLIPNGDGSYDAILTAPANAVITISRSRARALLDSLGL